MLRRLRADWDGAVLVCGKCSKKVGGGFGAKGKTPLAKALRQALKLKKGRRARLGVVESKCLGVCPKNAVTVLNAGAAREWLLVRPGTEIADVTAALGLARDQA